MKKKWSKSRRYRLDIRSII